jgi:Phosphotransferase enzyme family
VSRGSLRRSDDGELRGCLERALSEAGGSTVAVTALTRRPFAYETSFAIDELDVRLGDGSELRLLAKDVGEAGLSALAADVKPPFLAEPAREIAVYRDLLGPAELSTPRYRGATIDAATGRWWLFVERVDGEVLADVGDLAVWQRAADWAGRLGASLDAGRPPSTERLLVHRDARWHSRWIDAAIAVADREATARDAAALARLLRRNRQGLEERLDALPRTFVHGELYPSNVVVADSGGAVRIAPVDWELAGTGPYALDLAALTSGWGGDERVSMCRAFQRALAEKGEGIGFAELLEAVSLCGLALALQWIGWAPGWWAPAPHRHDWVAEALELLDELIQK